MTQVYGRDNQRKTTVDGSEVFVSEKSTTDGPTKDQMLAAFRKKSNTEPAIVLSKFRKETRSKRKATDENKNTVVSGQIQDRFSSGVVSSYGAFPGEVESVVLAGTLGSIASFSGSRLFSKVVDDAEKVDADIFNNFDFPITNLVFEGGGNKGMAYVGAIQVRTDSIVKLKVV